LTKEKSEKEGGSLRRRFRGISRIFPKKLRVADALPHNLRADGRRKKKEKGDKGVLIKPH